MFGRAEKCPPPHPPPPCAGEGSRYPPSPPVGTGGLGGAGVGDKGGWKGAGRCSTMFGRAEKCPHPQPLSLCAGEGSRYSPSPTVGRGGWGVRAPASHGGWLCSHDRRAAHE